MMATIRDVAGGAVVAAAGLVVVIPACSRARVIADASVDKGSILEIGRAMESWARSNDTNLPVPSVLDARNQTVQPAPGEGADAKDTTAAVYSILIFSGHVGAGAFVSRAEINGSIRVDEDYSMKEPATARNPRRALWDPAFAVDFTQGRVGNASFAHLACTASRRESWRISTGVRHPIVSHRGPEILAVKKNTDGTVSPTYATERSNAFAMFGKAGTWSGVVLLTDLSAEAWADAYTVRGRVEGKRHPRYIDARKEAWTDLLFLDEPDDPTRANTWLGIFPRAGARAGEMKPIWD